MTNGQALSRFCGEILKALEGKTNLHPWFDRNCGLCSNAVYFDNANDFKTNVSDILRVKFGRRESPFNGGDFDRYREERDTGTLYINEKRLAFLRKHANG